MHASLRKKPLRYDDVKKGAGLLKDTEMSPFAATQRLFDGRATLSIKDRVDLGFVDDLVPLLVQVSNGVVPHAQ